MLSVILSDDAMRRRFDADAAAAAAGDAEAQSRVELRWRKNLVRFAHEYKNHLDTTDIVPNAQSVEGMVGDWEAAIINHWYQFQTPEKQEEVRSDISMGNAAIWVYRSKVESKIREKRRKVSNDMGAYIASPKARQAAAFNDAPPAPKPEETVAKPPVPVRPAPGDARKPPESADSLEQLRRAEEAARRGRQDRQPERGAETIDQPFSGSDETDSPGVAPSEGLAGDPGTGLSRNGGAGTGGFTIKPPPSPAFDKDKPTPQKSLMGMVAKKIGPPVGGALLGAIVGAVGGPLGALLGAIIGGLVGYAVGKLFFSDDEEEAKA